MTMNITPEERKNARRKALQLLEHMDRTQRGLYDRLLQAGFSPEAAQDAIDYVKSYGYLDDFRYAQNYLSARLSSKSRQKLMQELLQKGIDRSTAQEAWQQLTQYEEPDERAVLQSVIEKKYPPQTRLTEKEMRRLHSYLARRGFHYSDITHVLDTLQITLLPPEP